MYYDNLPALGTKLVSLDETELTTNIKQTMCSFSGIPYYPPNYYKTMVLSYCRINYIYKHYDLQKFTFPKGIFELIINYFYQKQRPSAENSAKDIKEIVNKLQSFPKRIRKEIQRLSKHCPPGIGSIRVHPQNWRYFLFNIEGPIDTPYEGGTFVSELFLPKDYPVKPPKCRFVTPILHPNVDNFGRICLDILQTHWKPSLSIKSVMLSIQLLFVEQYPEDPLGNPAFERQYKYRLNGLTPTKIDEIYKKVREATKKYAM